MRLSALGDVAMTIPVVYALCNAYPATTFVLLTRQVAASLLLNAPANLQVCVADVKGRHKGIAGLFRLYRQLSEQGIDAVADLHDVLRTRLLRRLFAFSGCAVRVIDKGRAAKRRLTRRHHKVLTPLEPMSQRYADVFAALGMPVSPPYASLYAGSPADVSLYAGITPPKGQGERWVGIAPFAKHRGKIYPPEEMERVVALLSVHEHVHIFLFGSQGEAGLLQKWHERYPRVCSLAQQRHGFAVELALMSSLDVMLTMDSANMHLAALAGTPVVSVWGATHPYAGFMGYTASLSRAIGVPLSCRPCSVFGNKPCYRGDYACMKLISPQAIVAALMPFVAGHES